METLKEKLNKALEHFKSEIATLRTGRATPALVEDIEADYYGTKTPIKAMGAISTPEPRQIVIQPWDKNAIQPIEKAIQASDLGINPVVDGQTIRVNLPQLTEERRKDLIKVLGKRMEEERIVVRRAREDAIREVDEAEKKKEISEDEKRRKKEEIQKLNDETNNKIEELSAKKEQEIMAG